MRRNFVGVNDVAVYIFSRRPRFEFIRGHCLRVYTRASNVSNIRRLEKGIKWKPNHHTFERFINTRNTTIKKDKMSEPSFEAAVRTLEDMFPDLDPIVVRSVLDAKDGDMNETTTKLLAMSRSKRGGAEPSRGGGNGYGDAPRSESMGGGGLGGGIDVGGGEEINPYSRDAR